MIFLSFSVTVERSGAHSLRGESLEDETGFEHNCVVIHPENAIEAHRMDNNFKVILNLHVIYSNNVKSLKKVVFNNFMMVQTKQYCVKLEHLWIHIFCIYIEDIE
jgi:hypothetical protein